MTVWRLQRHVWSARALPVLLLVLGLQQVGQLATAPPPRLEFDAPAQLASAEDRLRRIDYDALERTLASAGLSMPPRITVTLLPRTDPRSARIPDWIVGLAAGTGAILILPDRIGPYPHDSLESVMRHEIVHLALNIRSDGHPLPRWFHEGVAVALESGWSTRDELRLLLAALDPPSMADISRLFASDAFPDTSQAYLLSAALVDETMRRHGPEIAGAIAEEVAAGAGFETAFERVTGETLDAAADRAWRGYRRLSRWFPVVTNPASVWSAIVMLAVVAFAVRWRRRREQRRLWRDEDDDDGPPVFFERDEHDDHSPGGAKIH